MRCSHLLVSLLLTMPATALAAGPVVSAGGLFTDLPPQGGDDCFRGMTGGSFKLGFEVGQRFRSEFNFNQVVLGSANELASRTLTLSGFGYQLAFHLRPKGFSPYVGLGVEMGAAVLQSEHQSSQSYWYDSTHVEEGPYLRAHAVLGLRYQMQCGLGVRGEMVRSTYGDFFATATNLGVSYSF